MSALRWLGRALITLALLAALGVAAALVFAPGVTGPAEAALAPAVDLIEEFDTEQTLFVVVGVVAAMSLFVGMIRKLSGGGDPEPVLVEDGDRPPESVSVDPATVTGAGADRSIEDIESLEDARARRRGLSKTAVAALQTAGESPERAQRRIAQGAWTDDELAAGFLGSDAPVPLLARLRGWLDGASEGRRRVVRSIDAVGELAAAPDAATRMPVEADEETDGVTTDE
ncbi:hypothetical protein JCM30237_09020 [Halolamina litorea]|uniref:Uncharacterized protein n=1 Tax=Halolamina litorea TaxID=1515593 RepID=A0ABD6BQA2_9EURY|nr:hypothetical protein [Halolamina litorea]